MNHQNTRPLLDDETRSLLEVIECKVKDIDNATQDIKDRINIALYCYCYKYDEYPYQIQACTINNKPRCKSCKRMIKEWDGLLLAPPTIHNAWRHIGSHNSPKEVLDPNPHLQNTFKKPSHPTDKFLLERAEELGWNKKLLTPEEAVAESYIDEFLYYYIWEDQERRRFQDLTEGYQEEFDESNRVLKVEYHLKKNWNAKSIMIDGERIDLS